MKKENSYSDLENERVKLIILLLSSVVAAGYRGFLNTLLYQRRQNKFSAYSQCVKISGAYTTHLKHPHGLHTEQPRRDTFKLSSVKELSRTTPLPCRLLPMSFKKSSGDHACPKSNCPQSPCRVLIFIKYIDFCLMSLDNEWTVATA